jgi:hypothetical protein
MGICEGKIGGRRGLARASVSPFRIVPKSPSYMILESGTASLNTSGKSPNPQKIKINEAGFIYGMKCAGDYENTDDQTWEKNGGWFRHSSQRNRNVTYPIYTANGYPTHGYLYFLKQQNAPFLN